VTVVGWFVVLFGKVVIQKFPPPPLPRTVSLRALVLDKMGRFPEALEDFNAAIQNDRSNATYYHNRGYCLRNMNKLNEAVDNYTAALRLDPSYIAAISNRG